MSEVPRRRALAALAETISACSACERLVAWRQAAAASPPASFRGETYWARPLPGFGDPGARLVVVGLAPAAHGGNRTGRMFTGDRTGDFLVAGLWRHGYANQALSRDRADGLEMTGAYLTAPVRCAPPDNKPTTTERDTCLGFLAEELRLLGEARVYLALGAFAYDCLGRVAPLAGRLARPRPRFAHGLEVHATAPAPAAGGCSGQAGSDEAEPPVVLCSYHPSQRNVFTGLLTAAMFDDVLGRARELTGS